MTSALFLIYCSLQATWSTVLHMTMSSTIDGPLELPVGHTCLWRISNPTRGNTPGVCVYIIVCVCVHAYNTHAWRGVDVSTCVFRFSDSRYHLAHGSHRKQEPELTNNDLLGCKIPYPHNVYDQVAASGAGARLWLGSVYFCQGVFISLSRHHIMHRIRISSGCLCASSYTHVCVEC